MNPCIAKTKTRSQCCHNRVIVEWVTIGNPAPDGHRYKGNLCALHLKMAKTKAGIQLPTGDPGPFYVLRRRGEKWSRVTV